MTAKEELKDIATHQEWAFEELMMDEKMKEANHLVSGGPKAMYEYLKERYGSGVAVLSALRDLLRWQTERRKTLGR